jgi:hypothetical protein
VDTTTLQSTEEKLQESAGNAISSAQESTEKLRSQARSRIGEQVDTRTTDLGEKVKSFADDLRSVEDDLRKDGKDQPAKLVEQVASRADDLGDYLNRANGDKLVNDLESFGRRNPWALAATGMITGFVASRFLKASSSERYRRSQPPRRSQMPYTSGQGNGQFEETGHDQYRGVQVSDPVTPEAVIGERPQRS